MDYAPARRVDHDLWLIDLDFQGTPGVVGAYLVTGPDGHTLIETGPGSTLAALEQGIRAAGARLEDVTQLALTHIHLDHAGAAGSLLRRLPNARLLVHPVGATHMIDPTKLLASAARIYGNAMEGLWGPFEAVPADRVTRLEEGATLRFGEREISVLHTPGHAVHHVVFYDEAARTAFTGDVAGVRLGHGRYVRPPTPPPDVDIDGWHASIHRLRGLGLRTLDTTHFGRRRDVDAHLDALAYNLDAWVGWIAGRIAAGADPASMTAELRSKRARDVAASGGTIEDVAAYELVTSSRMSVDGLSRWLGKTKTLTAAA